MRQNKHFVTIVCLILGAVLLCSAAVANIGNAGGYEAYKQGLLGLLNMDSYSGHGNVELTLDGTSLVTARYTEKFNKDAKAGEAISYTSMDGYSEMFDMTDGGYENWSVVNPEDHITETPYTYYEYDSKNDSWYINTGYSAGGIFSDFNIDTTSEYEQKMLRIAELAVDMFVGDLKNNFVYLGSEDGLRYYRISLSGDQLPEIVQAVMSLAFDNESMSPILYGSSSMVVAAIDMPEDVRYGDDYYTARREAWDVLYDHGDTGTAVINKDLSISWYPTAQDYLKTIGEIDLDELLFPLLRNNSELLFALLDGEPRITNVSCDLAIDSQGRLMKNTLGGSIEFRLIDGRWHEATLTINGEFDSRDEAAIELPAVNPNAALIQDHSQSCEENNYEYTVTENGRTTTYHSTIHASSDYGFYERFDRAASLHDYELLQYVFDIGNSMDNALVLHFGDDLTDTAGYYEIAPDFYVSAVEFDTLCTEWFSDTQTIADYANFLSVAPDSLMNALLEAYSNITGKPFEGAHAQFEGVHTVNIIDDYTFEYGPFGFVTLFASNMGLDLRYEPLYAEDFTDENIGDFYIADAKHTGAKFGIVAVSADDLTNVYYAMDDYEAVEPIASSLGLTYEEANEMFAAAYKCIQERSEVFSVPENVTLLPDSGGIYRVAEIVTEG